MRGGVTCSKGTDGALTVTVEGTAQLAPLRERVLLLVLDAQQQGAAVNADVEAVDPVGEAEQPAPRKTARRTPTKKAKRAPVQVPLAESYVKGKMDAEELKDAILAALESVSPCTPGVLLKAIGRSRSGRINKALADLEAAGRISVDGNTVNRTITLVE